MATATKERIGNGARDATDPRAEGLDEGHEEQHGHAVVTAGPAVVNRTAELGSHQYYVDVYPNMDWTPEEEMVL